jgi:hypothetical protein
LECITNSADILDVIIRLKNEIRPTFHCIEGQGTRINEVVQSFVKED